jgi:hypothetical protein
MQSTQTRGSEPTVPDVPRIHLRRDKVHTFERTVSVAFLNAPTAVDTFATYNFSLATLPNSTEYTTLFDQYRIAQITLTFQPSTLVATSSPLYSVIDYDDSNAPTSLNDLLQYDTLKTTMTGAYHIRTLNPRFTLGAYSGTLTSYANAPNDMWVDVASPGVQYYGVKICWPAFTGATGTFSVLGRYVVQFRNTR